MSIFEIKEWWATKVGTGEEFDTNLITVGNLDNSEPPKSLIAIGNDLFSLPSFLLRLHLNLLSSLWRLQARGPSH